MTADDVKARVAAIGRMTGDDELAHSAEDSLWRDVLTAIATHDAQPDPRALALAALETQGLDFARWCA